MFSSQNNRIRSAYRRLGCALEFDHFVLAVDFVHSDWQPMLALTTCSGTSNTTCQSEGKEVQARADFDASSGSLPAVVTTRRARPVHSRKLPDLCSAVNGRTVPIGDVASLAEPIHSRYR